MEEMKIEELVGSLQTYKYSLPLVRTSRHPRHLRRKLKSHLTKTLILIRCSGNVS